MLAVPRETPDAEPSAGALTWQPCGRARWQALTRQAGKSSLEQSWAYGEAVVAQHRQAAERHVLCLGGTPLALVQAFRKRYWLVEVTRIVRGPVWLIDPLDDPRGAAVCAAIARRYRSRRLAFLSWLPELPDDSRSAALIESQGLHRVVTGYASIWLDLGQTREQLRAKLERRWRNSLGKASRQGLDIARDTKARRRQAALLLYDSFRRKKRFVGLTGDFIAAIAEADNDAVLSLTARREATPVAGVVLVRHGLSATYLASWTSPAGRAAKAHNLLLWRGIEMLKADGVQWLDLGGLNTETQQGLARFKLGLRGEVFMLTGSYL